MKRALRPLMLRTACVLSTLLTAGLPWSDGHAQTTAAPPAASVTKAATSTDNKLAVARVVTVTAVVESKDDATRSLVLRGPRGRTLAVTANESVGNFGAIKVGDKVSAKVSEAATVSVRKGGDGIRESAVREGVASNASDGGAGATAARMTTVIANVWAIDQKKQVLSLRGPKGNVTDIQVHDPASLKGVAIGDQLEVKYVEAVALGLTRLPK